MSGSSVDKLMVASSWDS